GGPRRRREPAPARIHARTRRRPPEPRAGADGRARVMRTAVRRLALLVPTLLGVATLVFAFLHLVPGDPVEIMLGESAAPADVAQLRRALGLDRPLLVQYGRFLAHAARGDLGRSIAYRAPVSQVIATRYPATLELAGAALVVALAIALPLGIVAAV